MRTLVLLFLGFAVVAAVPSNPQRIVGGSTTTISQYPSMVALLATNNWSTWWQSCGGTLLNQRSVLTAAHCPVGDQVNRWRIRVGSTFANSGGAVHTLQTYILHPQYNVGARYNNDIAIMRSASNIGYVNNAVQPGTVAGANYNVGDGQIVWAAGWGRTSFGGVSSETLRHVQIWTVNQNICAQRYALIGWVVNENMLCSGWLDVGGRDQCQGDSGGPLYHNGVVVGVCSWGEECALARFPGVNARVSRYAAWIQSNA